MLVEYNANMNTGAILLCGSSTQKRQEKLAELIGHLDERLLKEDHPDRLAISLPKKKKNISINQIRALITFLSIKPYSAKYKIVTIDPADKMTSQAQNALLKTLEEPPFYAVIILSSKKEDGLLPTIVSRCRKIKSDTTQEDVLVDQKDVVSFRNLLGYTMGEKLKMAEDLAKKENEFLTNLLELWIKEERYEMTQNELFDKHENLELLLSVLKDIEETNVNVRLALENLFVKLALK